MACLFYVPLLKLALLSLYPVVQDSWPILNDSTFSFPQYDLKIHERKWSCYKSCWFIHKYMPISEFGASYYMLMGNLNFHRFSNLMQYLNSTKNLLSVKLNVYIHKNLPNLITHKIFLMRWDCHYSFP